MAAAEKLRASATTRKYFIFKKLIIPEPPLQKRGAAQGRGWAEREKPSNCSYYIKVKRGKQDTSRQQKHEAKRKKFPARRKAARIKFTVHGENGEFNINIKKATSNNHELWHDKNEVEISHPKKDDVMFIDIQFPFTGSLIMVEADYYEAK